MMGSGAAMREWADDPGTATWQHGRCSNDECGHQQSVRVVVQYGAVTLNWAFCDECGAPLEIKGE